MNAPAEIRWGHNALQSDLARYLRHERVSDLRVVWENIQVGEGRPDLYSIAMSPANPRAIAYEVKISRSDFLSDVTSGKWQKYLPYASGVVFAAPKGLIPRSEIPDKCGLIERSAEGWRFAKGPSLGRNPVLPQSFLIGLLTYRVSQVRHEARGEARGEWQAIAGVQRDLGAEVAGILRNRQYARGEAEKMREDARKLHAEAKLAYEREVARAEDKIAGVRRDLAELLGHPATSSLDSLVVNFRSRLQKREAALDADPEVKRLRELLGRIDSAISAATGRAKISAWD